MSALGLMADLFLFSGTTTRPQEKISPYTLRVFLGEGVFLFDLGPYFGRDDVTDDVILESSECLGKFGKCNSNCAAGRKIFSILKRVWR